MADQADSGAPDTLFFTANEAATEKLAGSLYEERLSRHEELLVLLYGELGAGKTAFCRGLGQAMGITETINSPSYNLLNIYSGQRHNLYHYDLYRLSPDEITHTEFLDYWNGCGTRTIHAVEWPQRLAEWPHRLPLYSLHFRILDAGREITFEKICSW
ncbi:MAG: tRNA (adenosine(37)-N6)-threonylcarbamoyltransferase complex ATPase subunit type 1 TsaE [Spirochaetales bacterium]|nr:tRNA (adenosine(37)-N6)-threonylcarbamoyltransferase complex ATPase subunit type 1 TsaE [Spirochaetales bacterium]